MTEWTDSILMMSKHRIMEKLEELNKEECLSSEDMRTYKSSAEALFYIMSVEKALEAKKEKEKDR